MMELRYTLVTDGSSDKVFLPILTWLLREHGVTYPIQAVWADLRHLRRPPRELSERLKWSMDLYPGDLLFVHRDAETAPRHLRVEEIHKALRQLREPLGKQHPVVCIVPIRMQEAWLLLEEAAIRKAAGNPSGRQPLSLPHPRDLENLPDPKGILYELLRQASDLSGRRLKNLRVSIGVQRVVEYTQDFTLLRTLSAFVALEHDIERVLSEQGWGENGS